MGLLAGVIALMVFVDLKQQALNLILGTWMTNRDECSAKHTQDFVSQHLCLDRTLQGNNSPCKAQKTVCSHLVKQTFSRLSVLQGCTVITGLKWRSIGITGGIHYPSECTAIIGFYKFKHFFSICDVFKHRSDHFWLKTSVSLQIWFIPWEKFSITGIIALYFASLLPKIIFRQSTVFLSIAN